MNTHDIELPPLPEARIVSYQTDSTMRSMELCTHSDEDMRDYARAAIEADRQARGDLISAYQAKVRALEAENYALISELEDRKLRGGRVNTDAAGYTKGPVSNGGMDPRNTPVEPISSMPTEPVAWVSYSPTKGNGRRLFWTKADAWRWSSNVKPLYATPKIPEGYKLVPIEPTVEMLGAALRHINGMACMPASYKAMLQVAPEVKL